MEEKYSVGVNRFAKNSFYIFENKDILQNALQLNRNAYPPLNSEVLFISTHGIMETVMILDIDKMNDKVTVRYKGENFRFDVYVDSIVTKWKSVNRLPPELIPYYNQSDSYILKESIENLSLSIDKLIALKEKHLKNIDSDSELREVEKLFLTLQNKIHNLIDNKDLEM